MYIYLHVCMCICICVLRRNFRIAFIQKNPASLDESNKASWIKFSFFREESLDWPHLHKSKGSRHLGPGGKIQQNFLEPDKILPSLHLLICRGSICGKGGQICIKVSEPPGRKENFIVSLLKLNVSRIFGMVLTMAWWQEMTTGAPGG